MMMMMMMMMMMIRVIILVTLIKISKNNNIILISNSIMNVVVVERAGLKQNDPCTVRSVAGLTPEVVKKNNVRTMSILQGKGM
jgi:hypothetical protein